MNTAIIILNWNGGTDTINCLNSIYTHLSNEEYIFIIDNSSTDDSIEIIVNFCEKSNISYSISSASKINTSFYSEKKCHIIKNKKNLGFGAGINVVLKQLHKIDYRFKYAWLLNNDAIADKKALFFLKQKIQTDDTIGAVGSILLNYPNIESIQNTGVKHFPYLGVSKLINKNKNVNNVDLTQRIPFDYLNGASLMLNLEAIRKVGYFDERFFLYSEEFDLQLALKKNNYKIELEPKSKVYHKLMGSTRNSSHLFFYYYSMSSTLLTKKHYSKLTLIIATLNLSAIMIIRTFPSTKNFYWSIKGIIKGLT